MLMGFVYAHAQETGAVGAANKLRARATLYEPLIASAAQRHSVDPSLLWTIAYLESRFRHEAISYKDGKPCAYGMMQFTAPTAARGDLILAAYNAGEGTVEAFRDGRRLVLPNNKIINPSGIRTGGVPPYLETRDYVTRGKIVYQSISRAGLFQRQAPAETGGSERGSSVSKTALEDAVIDDSIYTSAPAGTQSSQQPVKSP
jgi:soluble lytic murein transglycosylase-like protein